jgi:Sec-independent protein secretion pathway component TatC
VAEPATQGDLDAIVLVALVVSPGADPFIPTALFVPLIALFEASFLVHARVLQR